MLIAAAPAVQRRQAAPPQQSGVAVLGPRRDLHGDLALQGGHEHLAADDRSRHGNLRPGDQLGALSGKAFVRIDPHLDVEVALPATACSCVSRPGDPHPLAILDPGRDLDLPGPHLGHAPGTAAALAGRLRDPAVAAAAIARHRTNDLPEDAAAHLLELARALAARTGLDRGAWLRAIASAAIAEADRLEGGFSLLGLEDVLELELHHRGDVGARPRGASEAAEERVAASEDRVEDVLKAAEGRPGLEAAGAESLMPEPVVGLPSL